MEIAGRRDRNPPHTKMHRENDGGGLKGGRKVGHKRGGYTGGGGNGRPGFSTKKPPGMNTEFQKPPTDFWQSNALWQRLDATANGKVKGTGKQRRT